MQTSFILNLTFVFAYILTKTIWYLQFASEFRVSDYGIPHEDAILLLIAFIYIQISLFGLLIYLLTQYMHLLIEFCEKNAFLIKSKSFLKFLIFPGEIANFSPLFASGREQELELWSLNQLLIFLSALYYSSILYCLCISF